MAMGVSGLLEEEEEKERHHGPYKKRRERGRLAEGLHCSRPGRAVRRKRFDDS